MKLRPYQRECMQEIERRGNGRWICSLATGLGKTIIITNLKRTGYTLILAHKKELITQPQKYLDCPVGVEMAEQSSNGEEVVIATMQTLVKRLDKFTPDYFDRIVIDECHTTCSNTYRTILNHFTPKQLLGFTATAFRHDGKDLSEFFDEVIYEKDLRFGIKEGFLSQVECHRVDIGYDLTKIRKTMNCITQTELAREIDIESANKAIAEVYKKFPKPALIFAVNIKHAENIAKEIGPEAVVITGKTKNREVLLEQARNQQIKCIVSVQLFIEGVDIPCIQTGIMASPTSSSNKYIQSGGRVLRLFPGKEKAHLVDCTGNTERLELCTAACLLGFTEDDVPESEKVNLIGDLLLDLPGLIKEKSDCPDTWIKNIKKVKLFAKKNGYQLYNVNYIKHPDGAMIVSLTDNRWIGVECIDVAGNTTVISSKGIRKKMQAQEAFEYIFKQLKKHAKKCSPLWNTKSIQRWTNNDASPKQIGFCKQLLRKNKVRYNINGLKKGEISCIINRLNLNRK